jgi:hypothetical protein
MKYEFQTLAFDIEEIKFADLNEFDRELNKLFGHSAWEPVGMVNVEGKLIYTFRRPQMNINIAQVQS